MAADRTLMAWIRTALSMLSFGFTIYKVLEGLLSDEKIRATSAPVVAGLVLVGMGTVAMVLGTIEYWLTLNELNQQHRFSLSKPQLMMALLMSAAGIAMFVGIAAHVI
jgi:putative membrane protein